MKSLLFILLIPFLAHPQFMTGADVLVAENASVLKGKRAGIITNHTAILKNGTHLVDSLVKMSGVTISAIFGPEHGFRGNASAGEKVETTTDPATGLKVYSLYGTISKPTPEMLSDIDLLVFDMQDIGARFYTYISTLYKCIESAAENGKEFLVLDRPNPLGGNRVMGPVLEDEFRSFVGITNIPVAHGLTTGELALLFADEISARGAKVIKPGIIKCGNYRRDTDFKSLGLPWVSPSPNIKNYETILTYPGMCFLEGTNLSEGRGTDLPFLISGAPYINYETLLKEMKRQNIAGAEISQITFTPYEIKGVALNPKYKEQKCFGVEIRITDPSKYDPFYTGIALIYSVMKTHKKEFSFNEKWFDKLAGTKRLREMLQSGKKPSEIISAFDEDLKKFKEKRKKYLIYN
ncbi:MAG: DUF1343 domain-containing protein [Ignavibacteriaceae bacterium]|nr:DUF1343 domain-containing protein [Ignavibacteriaceae bacterium]